MSLEKRIEALESEIRAIRGNGNGWKLEYESSLEFQSNNFALKMASSVEKHLEALTALVGPSFKVENGQVFIKNAFIEEAPIQNAKYDMTLNIARGEEERSPAEVSRPQATKFEIGNGLCKVYLNGGGVVLLSNFFDEAFYCGVSSDKNQTNSQE